MVDTRNIMLYDVDTTDQSSFRIADEEDLSFAAFSLEHAGCGEDVLEVRIGEHALMEWCMACAVLRIFGSREK